MRFSDRLCLLTSLLLLTPRLSSAFYLPGVAPTDYKRGDKVLLNVNHLTPTVSELDDQLHSVISYDYYYPLFHFCRPGGGVKDVRGSLGSILFGDRVRTSPFDLRMDENQPCKAVCNTTFDMMSSQFVNDLIWQGYNVNWLIDGLPAAHESIDPQTGSEFYSPGFLLGSAKEDGSAELHNHYNIEIEYHTVRGLGQDTERYRVVGVLVEPQSRKDSKVLEDGSADCSVGGPPLKLSEDEDTFVTWTYSVRWTNSETAWATRWDKYLHVFDPHIHWYSLTYSAAFVVLLVGLVSTILLRALRKDIARYNRLDMINLADLDGTSAAVEDGIQEDSGWKLVHGDVFRCPKHPLLLSVFMGNGAQLFVMTGVTVGKFLLSGPPSVTCSDFRSVCGLWSSLSFNSRVPWNSDPALVYASELHRRILLGSGIQVVWGRSMEAPDCPHASADSWNCLFNLLFLESVSVDERV
jgi:transmembrane 9 superfamily protein 2/4